MRTKEQTEEIARLAKTTPEIVEAVLSAYYDWRYVIVESPNEIQKVMAGYDEDGQEVWI